MFGNLLVLTYDNFRSCAFVTVEDRSQVDKKFIISVSMIVVSKKINASLSFSDLKHQVRPLEKLNNFDQVLIDIDNIDPSYSLTMIETMTYFEAYRPVLNALQSIQPDSTFPLASYLLRLSNDKAPPDYVTPTTTYDLTPLLVDPASTAKGRVIVHEQQPLDNEPSRRRYQTRAMPVKEFRVDYAQSSRVPTKYKSVRLSDPAQWPTSEELHLNPKQRDALMLALTNKVALIQGRM